MMKKRVTAGLLALTLALSGGGLSVGVFEGLQTDIQASAETFGDYTYYSVGSDSVEITKYTGSATTLVIPKTINGKTVVSIGNRAFAGESYGKCRATNVVIPDTVTTIGKEAFYYCTTLKFVKIPDSVTSIGSASFAYCNLLSNVTIPDSVNHINTYAFQNCTSLDNVTIPDSVTAIGRNAFCRCTSLRSINIPKGVKRIEACTFDGCNKLTSVDLSEGVQIIDNAAFRGCSSLSSLTLPDGLVNINSEAFNGCKTLTELNFSSGVATIGSSAFSNCTSLKSITISDSVTTIGEKAFYNCNALNSITIPKSVTNIGTDAFCVRTTYKTDGFKILCYTGSTAEQYAIASGINYELIDGNNIIPETTAAAYNGAVLLDWEDVPDAEMYLVKYRTADDSTFTEAVIFDDSALAITGLTNGTKYGFVVLPFIDGRWSQFTDSDLIKATPNASSSEKSTLVNFNVTPGDGKVTVTWDKIPGAEKYNVIYKVSRTSTEYKEVTAKGSETSLTVDGLTNGATYYFVVSAYVNGNWSAYNGNDVEKATPTAEVVHEHEYTGVVTTEPTCTEDGIMTYTCECGEIYTEAIPATGHKWNEGEVTTEPTCTEDGVMTYTCECGETYTEAIPATGHTYTVTTVAPTETEEGYDLHICDKCGDSYKDKIVPPKPIIRYPVVSYEVSGNQFRLKWTAAAGAEKYGIAVYQSGGWRVKAQMNGNITTFTSPKMKPGSYKMVICAKVNGIWDTGSINSRAFTITI